MDPAPTSSIPSPQTGGIDTAPVGVVTSQPLAPISSSPLPAATAQQAPMASTPAYQPPRSAPIAQPAPAKVAPAPAPVAQGKTEKVNFVRGPQSAAEAKAAEAKTAAAAAPAAAPAKAAAAPAAKAEAPKAEAPAKPQQVAAVKPEQAAPAAAPAANPKAEAPAAAAADDDKPEFRWPARGRVIKGFKAGQNEGINIAVPEGTPVKAAEAGVVVYSGNEVKGYGNLVLIRHPNGFVSAYANNGELTVKRGDQVKRGQQIAKSGQTGDVSAPQLHFELRKGSTPVDPTQFLAGL
jgi:murein DD-endopeptidase MepM/ murein hydrolase activator NlpD